LEIHDNEQRLETQNHLFLKENKSFAKKDLKRDLGKITCGVKSISLSLPKPIE
jgi:hypothetical protein